MSKHLKIITLIATITAAIIATSANSQELIDDGEEFYDPFPPTVFQEVEGQAYFGTVTTSNLLTLSFNQEPKFLDINTRYGVVTFAYISTDNNGCSTPCPDYLEFYYGPDNVIVDPATVIIPENDEGSINLYYFIGM